MPTADDNLQGARRANDVTRRPQPQDTVFPALIGVAAGAALAAGSGRRSVTRAAAAGAVAIAAVDAVGGLQRRPNKTPPFWTRLIASAAVAAPLGWAVNRVTGAGPTAIGVVTGSLA